MHRMRHFLVLMGLGLTSTIVLEPRASASLIRPDASRAFPDISADVNGTVKYAFDSTTGVGNFHVANTPYLIAGGPTSDKEFNVQPDDTGVRQQIVNATLDQNGQLIPGPGNSYELHGTIVANGQTFTGLLLKGVPTSFGSQDLGPVGIQGSDVYDMNINITGGALASFFGPDAYMRITPELESTFVGSFKTDFSGVKATSNTRGYNAPRPFPIPEPATLALLLAGGVGLIHRHRRRLMGDGR